VESTVVSTGSGLRPIQCLLSPPLSLFPSLDLNPPSNLFMIPFLNTHVGLVELSQAPTAAFLNQDSESE
jgi:hypothetical protein